MSRDGAATADLTLGSEDSLTIDYGIADCIIDLENGTLQLEGATKLLLSNCGEGDGRYYTLLTGVSGLLDKDGNELTLNSSNNNISKYFDTAQPGTGFWANSTLQLTSDGLLRLVRHNQTVKNALTITSRRTNGASYRYYKGVSFENITFSSSSSASAWGGAIDGGWDSTIELSGNGSVTFSGNTASSSGGTIYGGAIGGYWGSTIELSGNGSVTFSGNTASSSNANAYGGAIYGSTVTLADNESVEFSGNTASSSGGAIYGSTTELSGNGSVEFSGNKASASSSSNPASAMGGAIYGSTIELSGNGSVTFSENRASSIYGACGGAICGDTITLSGNGSVEFSGNRASTSSSYYARGGAIYGYNNSTIELSGNGSVEFSGNTASSTATYADDIVYGGAICGYSNSTIELSGNGSVTFIGNTASASYDASGGAIYGYNNSTIELSGNDSVTFIGNTASASSSGRYAYAYGGAIYGYSNSTISVTNNQQVLFEKNAEVKNGAYRLRSIYIYSAEGTVNLSAPRLGEIRFNDSIYVSGKLALNADYTDDTNQIHAQIGVIIFSGEHTEEHLKAVKGGIAGTAEEIAASRESYAAMVELHAGNLHLEHGASLAGSSFTAVAGGASTVLLKDAAMSYTTAVFGAGTSLELEGNNSFNGSLQMTSGSTMSFILGEGHQNAGALTLNGDLTLEAGTTLQMLAFESGVYQVMSLTGSLCGWNADSLTLVDVAGRELDDTRLYWSDNVLYYSNPGPDVSTVSWSNADGDGMWNNRSYNWTSTSETYAYVQGLDVSFGSNPGEMVTLEGGLIVRNMQIQSGGNYTFAESAKGGSLEVRRKLEIAAGAAADIQLSRGISVGQELRSAGELKVKLITGEGDVVITGGSLELADDTDALAVSGEASISNATLKGNWTATELSIGASTVAADAEVTLRDVSLLSTLSNEGTLQLGGELRVHSEGFTKWNYSAGENGYIADAYTLVTGSGNSIALSDAVWTIMTDGKNTTYDYYRFSEGNLIAGFFRHTDVYWVNSEVTYDGRSEFDSANTLVLNGGKLTLTAALGDNLTNGIRAEADSALNLGSSLEKNGDTVHLNVCDGVMVSITEPLSGAGMLQKTGQGSLFMSSLSDTFTGSIDLQQGTLNMAEPLVISKGRELHVGKTDAVLDTTLQLSDGLLCMDFSGTGETVSLNNTYLHLQGETGLQLRDAGKEDGRVYDLFTDIYGLKDVNGNALVLSADNNAAALYFDAERPGTGFWKNATLQLTDDGTLQLVRYTDITIPTGYARTVVMDEPSDFTRYAGLTQDVAFRLAADVTFDASAAVMTNLAASRYFTSASADATAAIAFRNSENRMFYVKENETLIMKALRVVTFEDMVVSADEAISGGAIYVSDNSGISLEDNGAIIFSGTTLTANGAEAQGGALYAGAASPVVLNGNGSVEFLENSVVGSSSYGGAMYAASTVLITNNNGVIFRDNSSVSRGGAIEAGAELTLLDNGSVDFSGNTSGQGGAINAAANVVLEANGVISFSGNEATSGSGAAIYTTGDVVLTDNGSVEFSGNTASSNGGAVYGSQVTVSGNQDAVVFSENTATGGSGAAIYATGAVSLTDNGSVEFSGNTASSNGGAVYGSQVTVSGNQDAVVFSENTATGGSGAAIYATEAVSLTDNGSVEFSGNTASSNGGAVYGSQVTVSGNQGSVVFSENTTTSGSGAAIYTTGDVVLTDNGSVEFSGNTAVTGGGAIYGRTITVSDNIGAVSFIGNVSESSGSSSSLGGAIYGSSQVTFSGNNSVVFKENSAYYSGGAIYTPGTVRLSGNGSVEFRDNVASFHEGGAIYAKTVELCDNAGGIVFAGNKAAMDDGGAIYATSSITLSGNGSVEFSENTASYGGGAIWSSATVTINNHADAVLFRGNTASSSSYGGGAVYASSGVTLSHNCSVEFAENSTAYRGGAVYTAGSVTLAGNDEVTFARNVEKSDSNYRLRSLYLAGDSSADKLTLSAGKGQSISFYDSVYMGATGSVALNADYTDAEGVTQKASGTILFSGATTEDDLKTAKNGVAGTEEEILNSRTSEINSAATLYGGTLQVQDKAVLKLNGGLTVAAGSTATMQVQEGAMLNLSSMTIAKDAQTSIEVSGGSAMTASGQVSVAEGGLSSLKVQDSRVDWGQSSLALSSGNRIELQDNAEFNLSSMTIAKDAQASIEVSGGSVMTASGQVSVAEGGLSSLKVQDSRVDWGQSSLALSSGNRIELQDNAEFNLSDMTITENAQASIVLSGGSAMTTSGQVSVAAGGSASLQVQKSELNLNGGLTVAEGSTASLQVQEGATLNLSSMTIAKDAQASIELSGGSVMTASGQVSVAAGGVASLKVQNSEVNLGSNALELTSGSLVELQNGASLSLSELTVAAGAELKAGGYIAPVAEAAKPVAFSLEGIESDTPIVNTGSVNHVEGNLLLSGGSTLNLRDSYLTVTGDLVLDVTAESEKVVVDLMPGIAKDEFSQVVLFEVTGTVTFGENGTASDSEVVYYQFAEDYFTGDWISQDTWLVYDRSTNLVYLEGVNLIAAVPEPTTSLLGLMGMVAFTLRRRRK